MKKLIFISSPYRGKVQENVALAKDLCRYVMGEGHIPVAPHLFFPQFLDDSKDDERDAGMDGSLELLARCDELWLFGGKITDGMRLEMEEAIKLGKPMSVLRIEQEDTP